MTTKTVEGKTKCISDIITPSYADVQTLCKMVDKRDEIINNADAELLKRGCRISELEQECEKRGRVINTVHESNNMYNEWYNTELANNAILKEKIEYIESDGDNLHITTIADLAQELKCLKAAKDKTDAENTRLWALDKNEMHRKYEELCKHHTDEVCSLNYTIEIQRKRIAEMLDMIGGKEYTVTLHGDCIKYTMV